MCRDLRHPLLDNFRSNEVSGSTANSADFRIAGRLSNASQRSGSVQHSAIHNQEVTHKYKRSNMDNQNIYHNQKIVKTRNACPESLLFNAKIG
jgi:hypothetical protein